MMIFRPPMAGLQVSLLLDEIIAAILGFSKNFVLSFVCYKFELAFL